MIKEFFKMLIVGEKAKCEKFKKFLESIGFIFDCIKVEDKKINIQFIWKEI